MIAEFHLKMKEEFLKQTLGMCSGRHFMTFCRTKNGFFEEKKYTFELARRQARSDDEEF